MTQGEKQYTDADIKELVGKGRAVVVLFGAVYDLTSYLSKHPGGKDIILLHVGTDATEKFIEFGHLTKGRIIEVLTSFRIGKHQQSPKL